MDIMNLKRIVGRRIRAGRLNAVEMSRDEAVKLSGMLLSQNNKGNSSWCCGRIQRNNTKASVWWIGGKMVLEVSEGRLNRFFYPSREDSKKVAAALKRI